MAFPAVCVLLLASTLSAQVRFELHPRLQTNANAFDITLFDINGDGLCDAVYPQPFCVAHSLQGGHRQLDPMVLAWYRVASLGHVQCADLNGDGHLDILIPTRENLGSNSEWLFLGQGQGRYLEAPATHFLAPPQGELSIAVCDVDRDGDKDLIFGNHNLMMNLTNVILVNDGKAHFKYDPSLASLPPNTGETFWVATGDLDNDGDEDLVTLNNRAPSTVDLNDGKGHFTFHKSLGWLAAIDEAALVDYDHDGDLDIVCMAGRGFKADPVLFQNDGKANFTDASAVFAKLPGSTGVAFADVDDDGDLDMVRTSVTSATSPGLRLYLNDGRGKFTEVTSTAIPPWLPADFSAGQVRFADLDGDGDLDFMTERGAWALPSRKFSDIFWNMKRDLYAPNPGRIGKPYSLELYAPAGDTIVLSAAFADTLIDLGPLGILQLDPASLVSAPALSVPMSGSIKFTFQVPADPLLIGKSIYWQALDVDLKSVTAHIMNSVKETFQQ